MSLRRMPSDDRARSGTPRIESVCNVGIRYFESIDAQAEKSEPKRRKGSLLQPQDLPSVVVPTSHNTAFLVKLGLLARDSGIRQLEARVGRFFGALKGGPDATTLLVELDKAALPTKYDSDCSVLQHFGTPKISEGILLLLLSEASRRGVKLIML